LTFSFEAQQKIQPEKPLAAPIKLIDKGPAGVSLAPHWVLTGFESLGPFAIPGNASKHFM